MKAFALRTLCVSAMLAWFSQIRAYVLTEPDTKDMKTYIDEYQNRLASLVQFLERINSLSNSETSLTKARENDDDVIDSDNPDYDDVRRFIQSINEPIAHVVDIEKKDFAILPPASEWCRLMGFRGCRGNTA
ncbi:hypothetical protein ACF0H5_024135 [Mactra antiquata]